MRILVTDDNGGDVFSYEAGEKKGSAMCLFPGQAERPAVASALNESLTFLLGHNTDVHEPGTLKPKAPDDTSPVEESPDADKLVRGVTLTP